MLHGCVVYTERAETAASHSCRITHGLSESAPKKRIALLAIQKRSTTTTRAQSQELRESRGGRPGLSVLMSLTVSVDVTQH